MFAVWQKSPKLEFDLNTWKQHVKRNLNSNRKLDSCSVDCSIIYYSENKKERDGRRIFKFRV